MENPLLENIPSEGISSLLYFDADRLSECGYIKDILSRQFRRDAFKITLEGCLVTQEIDNYNVVTLRFILDDKISFDSLKSMINRTNYSIVKDKGDVIYMEGEKYQKRYCYVLEGEKYHTVKAFWREGFIDPKDEKAYNENLANLEKYLLSYDRFYAIEDSLKDQDVQKKDSFFNRLMKADEKRTRKNKAYDEVVSIPNEMIGLPFILHMNERSGDVIYKLIGKKKSVFEYITNSNSEQIIDHIQKLLLVKMSQNDWFGGDFGKDQLQVTTLTPAIGQTETTKLDQDLMQYMPSECTSFMNYTLDLEMYREKVIKSRNLKDHSVGKLKLGLLAMDEDLFNFFKSGMLSLNKTSIHNDRNYDLKIVFKMPNPTKGEYLLEILEHDFEILQKIEENTYSVKHPIFDDKTTYLVIENNIWILGTYSIEELKKKNENVLVKYPELGGEKTSMVTKIQKGLIDTYSIFDDIISKSEYMDDGMIRNVTTFKIRKDL
ncbi:hypothetical protein [Flammeovirga aprica]|uniref:Uncharacterized protein n=1 Tax=Flammeovirga aprica JL-4 TaxID=694437 RepID=A0A7X9XBC0_9BACT|nr:hypothetical protein [Flammeovirga aprica]NME70483.1 hypothetical protein [Flammeovirga aprica JL-4]